MENETISVSAVEPGKKPYVLERQGGLESFFPVMDGTVVYQHTATYAREHNELPQYRESIQANIACKEAIEKSSQRKLSRMEYGYKNSHSTGNGAVSGGTNPVCPCRYGTAEGLGRADFK